MPTSPTKHGTRKLSEVARHVVRPSGIVSTAWPSVRGKCLDMGVRFDAWQDGAGRLILSKRADGKYAVTIGGVAISIPRQVGKTFLLGAIIFALCLLHPGLTVLWTAHRTKTAGETFLSMQKFARRGKVAPHILKIFTGSGDEEVRFRNGSRILFGAREQGFGRGFAEVDIIVFDEAQILTDKAIDDMLAAANASRFPAGALILYTGTPPRPTDPGEVFTRLRDEALSGESEDTLYIELSADRDADLDDDRQLAKANPSYPHRTTHEAIRRMRKRLTPESYRREALGIWDEFSVHRPIIRAGHWSNMADVGPKDGTKPNALAVDMSHDREISVNACWLEESSAHAEEVWAGVDSDAAVEWVVERSGRRMPVVVDEMSPAASLVPALRARRVNVVVTRSGDMQKACGMWFDFVMSGRFTHAGQDSVDKAVAAAKKRGIGMAGGWGWDRKDGSTNIAPLVSQTLALFGASLNSKKPTEGTSGRKVVTF